VVFYYSLTMWVVGKHVKFDLFQDVDSYEVGASTWYCST